MVTGVAALLKSIHPLWGPAEVKSSLVNRGKDPRAERISAGRREGTGAPGSDCKDACRPLHAQLRHG
jgi:hypothetical protein